VPRVLNVHRDAVPPGAVNIMRPSRYSNPFVIGRDGPRSVVLHRFRTEVLPQLDVSELRGKDLVCCCKPRACHGDLLLEKANR
jgi:hypothetical protein